MTHPTVDYPPGEALAWAHRRRGPVVTGRLGRQRYVYLLGPEANDVVMANDGLFRVREAFAGLVPVDGPTSLVVSDGPDHTRRRALVRPGLHRRQVDGYVATMSACADEALDAAVSSPGPFDAYATFRSAIRRSTLRSLFGGGIAQRAQELGADLQPLLDLVDRLPQSMAIDERLNTPVWRRAMTARARVDAFVYA